MCGRLSSRSRLSESVCGYQLTCLVCV
uniref:Uncharacterized protein n=1 Tax=Arundo donax TaxID=35708 RepID=A0A0A9HEP7_ARUDO